MGTEIAVPFFGPLILIGTAILLYLAIRSRRSPVTGSSMLGLGWSRIAIGYLCSLLALVAYCYMDTTDLSRMKIARGDVTAGEPSQYFFGWFLNIFCLVAPFMFILMTALGLPLLSVLRRVRFASVLGTMMLSQLVAACFTWIFLSPYTDWCKAHELLCFKTANKSNAILAGLLTAGFALGARLPWLFSSAMPANNRLEQTRVESSSANEKGDR